MLVIECTNVDPTEDMQYWRQAAAEEAGVGEQTAVYNPEEEVLIVFSLPEGNQFARFRPDDSAYAPPRMAAQAPPADELWEDAEA
ncbi:MAG: hypothetical protein M5U34_29515 [Chloroflexi bacterium]|nr:hypothetical protein [Chloroflexota bacterium]